jgi:cyanuric acid amidohydrolase
VSVQIVEVFRVVSHGPGDCTGIKTLIEQGVLDPNDIVAILGKTEGNGGVNDFTREYATTTLSGMLAPLLGIAPTQVEQRIAFVMSGGTEGVLSPHLTIFTRRQTTKPAIQSKRLSVGIALTRVFLPEEIGRPVQIEETAKAVQRAMADANIDVCSDVHYVQIKCPLLTAARVENAHGRGMGTLTGSSYASMAYSRGASSLGVALALGELDSPLEENSVLKDWHQFSHVASASAGVELMHSVVIVLGNSPASASNYVVGHAVMHDAIDRSGLLSAFVSAGIASSDDLVSLDTGRIVNVFAKAEASPNGQIRGYRHTMLDDTDISATRHARAAVGGLIAGFAGHGAVYVSGGAEHQGPAGGGPVAVVARV